MESQGACEIFLQSVGKHNLKHTKFVGNRDKWIFAKVRESCEKVFKGGYVAVNK